MGQIKNIKLHIVTDIKREVEQIKSTPTPTPTTMALSLIRQCARVNTLAPLLTSATRKYADAAGGALSLTFGSPGKAFFENADVTQVDVPSMSGNFAILPQHVPIIAVLRPGLMTVLKDGESHKFIVSSGTITVNADSSAQILAEEAQPLDHFDLGNAQKSLDAANAALGKAGADEMAKAAAQIEVDTCAAILEALK